MIKPFLFSSAVFALAVWGASCGRDKPTDRPEQDIDPVLSQLNTLVEQNPKSDSFRYLRAEYYYNLEAYDEALLDLNAAMQLDSMQPRNYHLLADVLLDYGRPNDSRRAIVVMEDAVRKFPDRIPTLLKLSEFHLIVQQHGEALKALDQILRRDPQNSEAYYMAGRVALDKGDTLNAIASMRQSLLLDAENVDGWLMLGRMLTNRKDPQAVQCFDNALRIDPESLEALEYKAAFFKRMGRFDEAFTIYRDIIMKNPYYANAFFDMGAIYLEMDSLEQAYKHFDMAVKSDPLFVKAYYYRGVANELSGKTDAALADYSQANRMSPNYPEAKEALERLKK